MVHNLYLIVVTFHLLIIYIAYINDIIYTERYAKYEIQYIEDFYSSLFSGDLTFHELARFIFLGGWPIVKQLKKRGNPNLKKEIISPILYIEEKVK